MLDSVIRPIRQRDSFLTQAIKASKTLKLPRNVSVGIFYLVTFVKYTVSPSLTLEPRIFHDKGFISREYNLRLCDVPATKSLLETSAFGGYAMETQG